MYILKKTAYLRRQQGHLPYSRLDETGSISHCSMYVLKMLAYCNIFSQQITHFNILTCPYSLNNASQDWLKGHEQADIASSKRLLGMFGKPSDGGGIGGGIGIAEACIKGGGTTVQLESLMGASEIGEGREPNGPVPGRDRR